MRGDDQAVTRFDAIILAGGRGERMGGVDKAMLHHEGTTLLDGVLAAVAAADEVICVGPRRPTASDVWWTREDPIGGGPVAALAAAIDYVTADIVCVLACDLPQIDAATVVRLIDGIDGNDGCVSVDATGRVQYLTAAYKRESLGEALKGARTRNMSMRELTAGFSLASITADTVADVDTVDDLDAFDLSLPAGDPSGKERGPEPHHRD